MLDILGMIVESTANEIQSNSLVVAGPSGQCEFTICDMIDAKIEYKTNVDFLRRNLHVTIDMDFTLL